MFAIAQVPRFGMDSVCYVSFPRNDEDYWPVHRTFGVGTLPPTRKAPPTRTFVFVELSQHTVSNAYK